MNKILHLFDQAYVKNLFDQKILPLYPGIKEIKQIKIIPIKKSVWETTYHVVIKFPTTFLADDGALVELPIYLSAHSSEPRKNSFAALSFLWRAGFNQGDLVIPHPLFFSSYFNGYFYRGVRGQTLYYYLNNRNFKAIEAVVAKTAAWFAKLHNLPTLGVKNFHPDNSRIETVIPGSAKILTKIKLAYPKYFQPYQKIYETLDRKEKKYFAGQPKLHLIHGDAHPKNVVKVSKNKIAVIDFTDICLADFARDLGSFLQQLEFMAAKKINDQAYIDKLKKMFLKNYLLTSENKINDYVEERINNYYNWTASRTAAFFLLKERPEPERSRWLIAAICHNLKIKTNI